MKHDVGYVSNPHPAYARHPVGAWVVVLNGAALGRVGQVIGQSKPGKVAKAAVRFEADDGPIWSLRWSQITRARPDEIEAELARRLARGPFVLPGPRP